MRITVNLSVDSINNAINQLNTYKQRLNERVNILLDIMAQEGETFALLHLNDFNFDNNPEHSETTVMSYREGNKGIIVAGGNAMWVEFGTGVLHNTTKHPKADELGMSPWGTYGKGKGASLTGWWYWDDARNMPIHTEGITANMFMYNTAKYLRERLPRLAQEIFSND